MKKLLKPKDVAEIFGVSVKTIQRWDVDKKLVAKRNPKGRRYYTQDQIDSFLSIQSPTDRWNDLLDQVIDGKIGQIYVTEKDRFIRFGFDWFASFVEKYGSEIVVVNNETLSPQKEVVQDLISIIDVFSCKVYGLRKYKNKLKGDDEL